MRQEGDDEISPPAASNVALQREHDPLSQPPRATTRSST
jgi:hypothetical protein